MIDVTGYKTCAGAAKAIVKALHKLGYPEACVLKPEDNSLSGCWAVILDGGPFEALVCLSLGGSMYASELGYHDSDGNYREPEIKMTGAENWYAEPYYSWHLDIVPD